MTDSLIQVYRFLVRRYGDRSVVGNVSVGSTMKEVGFFPVAGLLPL